MNIRIQKWINRFSIPGMWAGGICTALGLIADALGGPAGILFAAAAICAGIPILYRAIQGLRFRTVGIECLVSIAVIGAFAIGELSEAAIVTFLFQFGSWLEQKTMKKTRSAIKALTQLTPDTAWRLEDGEAVQIDADEVAPGDILLAKTGSRIASDGTVVWGEGYAEEAAITGESQPRKKTIGDPVYAGTILDSGTLHIRSDKVGEDTTFARIIALVEEAQDAKSPQERFIDKFAKYYTPAVVVLAALVFLILRNADTAITVLVLACPGALVIGAPIANVAGIGRGAQQGILLKGGDSIHTFAKTDTVVFDKTGTLTQGRPEITEQRVYAGDAAQALELAACAEFGAEHPLAKAVLRCAGTPGRQPEQLTQVKGMGVIAQVDGHTVLAGNLRLLEQQGVPLPEEAPTGTAVYVAVDGELRLGLTVSDPLKPSAVESIRRLKAMGIRHLALLTGDNAAAANAAARQLGLDTVYSELLPQDKLTIIRDLQAKGRTVTFLGDGVNDSPALTAADTGIAMGGGTDAAIDCSDVVLIRSDPAQAAAALDLARKTAAILRQNIAIAIGTVLFLLVGLFAGFIHMAVGMLVHEASILAVILNAMRLIRRNQT